MVREGRVLVSSATRPAFGSAYSVVVLPKGGQVRSASSGTTINLEAGHGFSVGQKLIVGLDTDRYRRVTAVTGTSIDVDQAVSVAVGEFLINLGSDTGSATPNYDGGGQPIFADMGFTDAYADSTVATDLVGRYRYFHEGTEMWELVLSTGTPVAYYLDAGQQADNDRVFYGIRYAHLFATSGQGTAADPWAVSGSNPVQAALDDLPVSGGTVHMIAGYYDLGTDDVAVNIPVLTSGLDRRQYVFRGEGRDLVFLQYQGTGSAFRYAQVNAGVAGSSWQSNQLLFTDFAVCQAGTDFTGNAFYLTYVNECLLQRLTVGTPRIEGGSFVGEPGYGFEYGIRLDGTPGDNVVDFNRIDECLINGNTKGVYAQNQADNLSITRCWFQPDLANTSEVYGVEIHNSNGYVVQGNHFNYYGRGASFAATSFALKLSGYIRGANVIGNYFKDNPVSIWVNNTEDGGGVNIIGNMISFNGAASAFGVYAGILSSAKTLYGLNVIGNSFVALSATNTGIKLFDNVSNFVIQSNCYEDTGGTIRTIQTGAKGVIMEHFSTANPGPMLWLVDKFDTSSDGEVRLQNTSTGSFPSPRVKFLPGTGGSGSGAGAFLAVASSGDFQVQNDAGLSRFSVDQNGAITSVSNATVGGQLRRSVSAAVTASTTHTQAGGTALTADINNVSVCANADDAVTLPTAVAGMTVVVMNNGAQNLRIWPASGDNLGTGADTVRGALASGSNARFTSFDATNWEEI